MNKRIILFNTLLFLFFSNIVSAVNLWKPADIKQVANLTPAISATKYLIYSVDENALKTQLFNLANDYEKAMILSLPMPDGRMSNFRVWQTPMMPGELAAKYSMIKTFTGALVEDPTITAKLDFTLYGFHAMIFDGGNSSFIDPYDNSNSGYYLVHYKRDELHKVAESTKCLVHSNEPISKDKSMDLTTGKAYRTFNGHQLRTYRLALSCSHQYAIAATSITTPLVSQVFSKMTTTMNRINGVYERELSVTMVFAANEYLLIDTSATDDPFGPINDNQYACISTNQTICDTKIGSANYDIGHVFITTPAGVSQIGMICQDGLKAQSATGQPNPTGDGFDIDYVAHEMGHAFGSDHTFNNNKDGSCINNAVPESAYEPGSGSTIMAYAGICDPDDVTTHSSDYFHAISLQEIQWYITHAGDACSVKSPTSNKLVYLPSFSTLYNIPFLTPFELTAPAAIDSVADTLTTYCWEQWDLGDFGVEFVNAHERGPIFRSYQPKKSQTRIFPKDTMVLAWNLSNAGIEAHQGEKAPDVARILTFRLTMRDIYQGMGCFLIPDDSILLNVINTGEGFKVTSQGDSLGKYYGNSLHEVTWDVVGTNAGAVNTPYVDIFMSVDGGYTWPYTIGTFPNNGITSVPLPNPAADETRCRIKVKGSGNVFFNVNRYNFTVIHSEGADTTISIYPVPAHSTLRISAGTKAVQQFVIFNSVGQVMYRGKVDNIYDVAVNLWPRGVYILKLVDDKKNKTIRKFVVE